MFVEMVSGNVMFINIPVVLVLMMEIMMHCALVSMLTILVAMGVCVRIVVLMV